MSDRRAILQQRATSGSGLGMKKITGILLEEDRFVKHDTGAGHPESSARYRAISKRFTESKLLEHDGIVRLKSREAGDEEIERCHDPAHVALAREEIRGGRSLLSTGDTNVCADTLQVALHAVGATLNAVDAIYTGEVRNAFCAVRPPGHHATPSCGMGFCVFNSAAIAARYAQKKHGAEKVAIIDWDVHHGNGTQDIFYEDPSVFYFSTHQSPWYPGTGAREETGAAKGRGTTMNAPLPAGTGMAQIGQAFEDRFLPAMEDFKPDLILISAGFDSRIDDPLGNFLLTDEDFATLTGMLTGLASRSAESRIVSVLEGGYNVDGLACACEAHVRALLNA